MSSSDSKCNRSEKGKARYARYRDAHREEISWRARWKRLDDPLWAVVQDIKRVARRNQQRKTDLYS